MDKKKDKNQEKDLASVSYVPFICLIALYRRKDSEFIQFHARQGTAIFVLIIIAYVLGHLGGIFEILEKIAYILLLSAIVIGFSTASQGEKHEITFISEIAKTGWDLKKIMAYLRKILKKILNIFHRLLHEKEQKKTEEEFEKELARDFEKLKKEEKND